MIKTVVAHELARSVIAKSNLVIVLEGFAIAVRHASISAEMTRMRSVSREMISTGKSRSYSGCFEDDWGTLILMELPSRPVVGSGFNTTYQSSIAESRLRFAGCSNQDGRVFLITVHVCSNAHSAWFGDWIAL